MLKCILFDYSGTVLVYAPEQVGGFEGGFAAVADRLGFTGADATEFCERLLREGRVMIFPGKIYGDYTDDYARLSLTQSVPRITEALHRMADVVGALRRESPAA